MHPHTLLSSSGILRWLLDGQADLAPRRVPVPRVTRLTLKGVAESRGFSGVRPARTIYRSNWMRRAAAVHRRVSRRQLTGQRHLVTLGESFHATTRWKSRLTRMYFDCTTNEHTVAKDALLFGGESIDVERPRPQSKAGSPKSSGWKSASDLST